MKIDFSKNFHEESHINKKHERVLLFIGCNMIVTFKLGSPLIFEKNGTQETFKCNLPKGDTPEALLEFKKSIENAFHTLCVRVQPNAVDYLAMRVLGVLFHKKAFSKLTYHGLVKFDNSLMAYDLGQSYIVKKTELNLAMHNPMGIKIKEVYLDKEDSLDELCTELLNLDHFNDGYITPKKLKSEILEYLF